ncbi:glucose-6-phosphate dehydrogenase [Candidatus Vampirococcus lugosii]|uniref:Glucose-6-phosphate 1-dehydrogenase n=1 Tax=Candidatus Vampirococcus lugosii TaxID=2789015 RepID=A0ABS5QN76_9BACT|nr:glucose-6-phosphate dehydrogenase [Candidatus Vampirococcus lugosii]MBS8122474.1 Glucose-6-phosphate 1-dehydrogenase [Candidatus Vampirococcus lugosii]
MKTVFVLFGSTGDLARRKILPSIFEICKSGKDDIKIIAVGRRDFDNNDFYEYLWNLGKEFFIDQNIDNINNFIKKIDYQKVVLDKQEDYIKLSEKINDLKGKNGQTIIHLSVSPEHYHLFLDNAKAMNLDKKDKVIFEKPFGNDLNSSIELNNKINLVFDEEQVYRIDHYLGKEAVQNIIFFRFANLIFEPIWNNKYIDNIQIFANESIGVGDRGDYYENYGAIKDMLQNHLLQMLTLVSIEKPKSFDANSISDEKIKILKSIKLGKNFEKDIILGQYKGYLQEKGVGTNSKTETYVSIKLEINNSRFTGIPIYLTTGKCLKEKSTKIIINFKNISDSLFESFGNIKNNKIELEIQTDENINIYFNGKIDENRKEFKSKFEKGTNTKEAYEKLIKDCIDGNKILFTRFDVLQESWIVLNDLLTYKNNSNHINQYDKGSDGPIYN